MRRIGGFLALVSVAAWVGCADAKKDDNNNTSPDAGADGGSPALVLQGVSPGAGPLAGSTQVELTGRGFAQGMTITFGGNAATQVAVLAADRATCVTPAGDAAGPVTVRVENPDAQASQLLGAFTYREETGPDVTWCRLQRPTAVTTETQAATEPIYGQVFAEGLTDAAGRGLGLTGQLGYGPTGTDPATSTAWIWAPAVYAADASTLYDEYVASLTVPNAGTYDVAYRFSAGGQWLYCDRDSTDNGYQTGQALVLTVTETTLPQPDWCGLVGPLTLQATAGDPTGTVTGQVLAVGVTEGAGAGANVEAELGYGPAGTHPGVDPGWHFAAATYQGDVGDNDEYASTLTVAGPGSFDYAFRVRLSAGPWLYCDGNGSDDGYSASYAGDLTVTGQPSQQVDWCKLQYPPSTSTEEGTPTELIFGRVYAQGLTEGNGQGMGILAEVGYGDPGTDPATHGSWQWTTATYNLSVDGLTPGGLENDEYMSTLTVASAGTYDYAYRFSADNGLTWLHCDQDGAESPSEYSAAQAGILTVTTTTTTLTLTSVDLPRGSLLGGDTVTLTGAGFTASTTVSFGGVASPGVTFTSSTSLEVTTPAGAALGAVDVVVTNPGPTSATLAGGFEYLLVHTPVMDGDLADWPAALRVAENTVATDWGVGQNELTDLYVAFDDTNLYLGVGGVVQADNAIQALLDLDFGQSTGVSDFSSLTDASGALDVTIAGVLNVTATGFGAEAVMGTKGMAAVTGGVDAAAGWRGLSPGNDLPWLTGTVSTGTDVVEASVPLATLWPGGIPASGVEVAVVVKIADFEGTAYAVQALPEQAGDTSVTQVFSFRIFPAGSF